MDDTIATYDDKLAMIMAMSGATIEKACQVLDESGGDVDEAMELLKARESTIDGDVTAKNLAMATRTGSLNFQPTRHSMVDDDDDMVCSPRMPHREYNQASRTTENGKNDHSDCLDCPLSILSHSSFE